MQIKDDRERAAIEYNAVRSSLTNLSYQDILHGEELNKLGSIQSLKRKEV